MGRGDMYEPAARANVRDDHPADVGSVSAQEVARPTGLGGGNRKALAIIRATSDHGGDRPVLPKPEVPK